jgi:hypothetical protein
MQQSKFLGLQSTKYGLLTPEHEAIRFLRNVGNHLAQSALCNTPEDLNFQQYSCETATMKEEFEKKINIHCCNANEKNGTVWLGSEISKLS